MPGKRKTSLKNNKRMISQMLVIKKQHSSNKWSKSTEPEIRLIKLNFPELAGTQNPITASPVNHMF